MAFFWKKGCPILETASPIRIYWISKVPFYRMPQNGGKRSALMSTEPENWIGPDPERAQRTPVSRKSPPQRSIYLFRSIPKVVEAGLRTSIWIPGTLISRDIRFIFRLYKCADRYTSWVEIWFHC